MTVLLQDIPSYGVPAGRHQGRKKYLELPIFKSKEAA